MGIFSHCKKVAHVEGSMTSKVWWALKSVLAQTKTIVTSHDVIAVMWRHNAFALCKKHLHCVKTFLEVHPPTCEVIYPSKSMVCLLWEKPICFNIIQYLRDVYKCEHHTLWKVCTSEYTAIECVHSNTAACRQTEEPKISGLGIVEQGLVRPDRHIIMLMYCKSKTLLLWLIPRDLLHALSQTW